jgi:hypothetical protein
MEFPLFFEGSLKSTQHDLCFSIVPSVIQHESTRPLPAVPVRQKLVLTVVTVG